MDKPPETSQSSGQLFQPVLYFRKKEEGSHQRPHTFTHLLEMPEYFELILCEKDLWSAGVTLLTRVLEEQGRTSHRGVLNKELWPSAVDSSLQDSVSYMSQLVFVQDHLKVWVSDMSGHQLLSPHIPKRWQYKRTRRIDLLNTFVSLTSTMEAPHTVNAENHCFIKTFFFFHFLLCATRLHF